MLMEKLSLKEIFVGAFVTPWWHRKKFVKIVFPILFSFLGMLLVIDLTTSGMKSVNLKLIFTLIFFIVIYPILAIECHRIILVESIKKYEKNFSKSLSRIFKFICWMLALGVIGKLVSFPFPKVPNLIASNLAQELLPAFIDLGFLPALYVAARFSLVLPSTAIDRPASLMDSWNKTKGVGWKMFAIIFLFPSILILLLANVSFGDGQVLGFLKLFLFIIVLIIEFSALSLAYQHLVKEPSKNDIAENL